MQPVVEHSNKGSSGKSKGKAVSWHPNQFRYCFIRITCARERTLVSRAAKRREREVTARALSGSGWQILTLTGEFELRCPIRPASCAAAEATLQQIALRKPLIHELYTSIFIFHFIIVGRRAASG